MISGGPKAPRPPYPNDPADAGDLLILADIKGEILTIIDGRGVGLILILGDGQGKVVNPLFMPNYGTDRISLSCEQALEYLEANDFPVGILVDYNQSDRDFCRCLEFLLTTIADNLEPQLTL